MKLIITLMIFLSLFAPVNAIEKEKGKIYLGDLEIKEGDILEKTDSNNDYINKMYVIPGASELLVQYETISKDGKVQLFTDTTAKCDDSGCNVRFKALDENDKPGKAIFTYKIDGQEIIVNFSIKGNAPAGSVASSFMYQYTGDYIVDGKIYTVNNNGNTITINNDVISNVNLGIGNEYNLNYDGKDFVFNSIYDEVNQKSDIIVKINGARYFRRLMDLEAVGLDSIDDGLKEDFTKTVTIVKGETVEVIAKNVSKMFNMKDMSPDCYKDTGKPGDMYDNKYPFEKLDNGYKLRIKFDDLGTYCVGWNNAGKKAHFRFVVVDSKSEVISEMTKENATETITSLQNVLTPNNENITISDIEQINKYYPEIVETTYSGNISDSFNVLGLAPALIKINEAKDNQTVDLSVNESKENITLDQNQKLIKTLDIKVSSNDASMSTTELQIPVVITFDASKLDIDVLDNQELKVVRNHNGKQELLDVVDNGDGTYSFITDKFSTYAIISTERNVDVEDNPSIPTISCAGSKDKNCDGVVTCDEEKGIGWEWNNDKKVCEFKGNSNIYIVNTATK